MTNNDLGWYVVWMIQAFLVGVFVGVAAAIGSAVVALVACGIFVAMLTATTIIFKKGIK